MEGSPTVFTTGGMSKELFFLCKFAGGLVGEVALMTCCWLRTLSRFERNGGEVTGILLALHNCTALHNTSLRTEEEEEEEAKLY